MFHQGDLREIFMKRIAAFCAAAAVALPVHAADIYGSAKDGPAPYAPALSWTGFYVGAHVGYVTGDFDGQASSNPLYGPLIVATQSGGDFDGFLGGVTVGANHQIGALVIGIEADGSWGDQDAT